MILHTRKYSLLHLMFGVPGGWSLFRGYNPKKDPVPSHIEEAIRRHMPHGSGIDAPITVKRLDVARGRLVLDVPFHRMDDNGMYRGWVNFTVTVQALLDGGVSVVVRGACRDSSLKEYLGEMLHYHLTYERFLYGMPTVEMAVIDRFVDYDKCARGHFASDFERAVYEQFEVCTESYEYPPALGFPPA